MRVCEEVAPSKLKFYEETLSRAIDVKPSRQGFSLPQMGIYARAFICHRKGVKTFMANPVILKRIGKWNSNEGCETVKGRHIVKRPLLVKVKYQDSDGEWHTKWFTWKMSRIICHEADHLNGKTIDVVGKKWRAEAYANRFK